MKGLRWGHIAAGLALLALMTVAAQCTEPEQTAMVTILSPLVDTMIAEGPTLFPEATATPTPTPKPEPTEVGMSDERRDILNFVNGRAVSEWTMGLDSSGFTVSRDPETGMVSIRVSVPEVEDDEAFLHDTPYFGLVVAGDGDPEGTSPVAGLSWFGMGQWHVGCFVQNFQLRCELWVRQDGQFEQEGESFDAAFVEGAWAFTFPQGFPRVGDRIGVALFDPYYVDTIGLEDQVPIFYMEW